MDQYLANAEALKPLGYEWHLTTNLKLFRERVGDLLGLRCSIEPGTGKLHDYRPALGLLFQEELRGFDFWGHTDFDCVYGRVDRFVTDDFLGNVDIHANHVNYICGPWTLYRNDPKLARLFMESPDWREVLLDPLASGWAERGFTELVDQANAHRRLRRKYTHWQGERPADTSGLSMTEDGALLDDGKEIMMFHFRHTKEYPQGVRFA